MSEIIKRNFGIEYHKNADTLLENIIQDRWESVVDNKMTINEFIVPLEVDKLDVVSQEKYMRKLSEKVDEARSSNMRNKTVDKTLYEWGYDVDEASSKKYIEKFLDTDYFEYKDLGNSIKQLKGFLNSIGKLLQVVKKHKVIYPDILQSVSKDFAEIVKDAEKGIKSK